MAQDYELRLITMIRGSQPSHSGSHLVAPGRRPAPLRRPYTPRAPAAPATTCPPPPVIGATGGRAGRVPRGRPIGLDVFFLGGWREQEQSERGGAARRVEAEPRASRQALRGGIQKSMFERSYQLLAIHANKMAPRTGQSGAGITPRRAFCGRARPGECTRAA